MLIPTITALYAGLLALIYLVLTINVIRGRIRFRVGLGDGGERKLQQLVRSHGNFSEYAPMMVVLLLLLELSMLSGLWLHLIGGGFVMGRLCHAIGIGGSSGPSLWRTLGMLLTMAALLASGVLLVYASVQAMGLH